jgi:hypothetical protein
LLELGRIGRGDKQATGSVGHALQCFERLFGLGVEADHMDAQARHALFQRLGRGADIRLAAVETVGDQDDVEASAWRRRALDGLAKSGRDRFRQLWLEAGAKLKLAAGGRGQLTRLRQELAFSAWRRVAMAEGHEPKGDPVLIVAEGLVEAGAHERDFALAAQLRPHAPRAVEHDDGGRGRRCRGRSRLVLGEYGDRAKEGDWHEHTPKPRAAIPSHHASLPSDRRQPLYPVLAP